jgi:hypothetical protein
MAVTLAEFQAYVGTEETTFPQECLTAGHALVTRFVGTKTVPESVHDQATLIASSELFHVAQLLTEWLNSLALMVHLSGLLKIQ